MQKCTNFSNFSTKSWPWNYKPPRTFSQTFSNFSVTKFGNRISSPTFTNFLWRSWKVKSNFSTNNPFAVKLFSWRSWESEKWSWKFHKQFWNFETFSATKVWTAWTTWKLPNNLFNFLDKVKMKKWANHFFANFLNFFPSRSWEVETGKPKLAELLKLKPVWLS